MASRTRAAPMDSVSVSSMSADPIDDPAGPVATGAWVIAMPRADRSLRAELEGAGGRLAVDAVLSVLIDIASALEALDGRVP